MAQQSDNVKVRYNCLGRSGLLVSNICLGTSTFGKHEGDPYKFFDNQNQVEAEKAYGILNKFAEAGGNFIDTADMYSYGKSEEILGNWLSSQNRDQFVIATKCGGQMDMTDVNSAGLSRKHIMQSVEGSLKRLQTDHIDLLNAHVWDVATPIEETLQTLDDLVRSGKVRYIGCSNVCGWQLQKIVDLSKSLGLQAVISLQQQYNLLTRTSELEAFQVCKFEGIGVTPYMPLKKTTEGVLVKLDRDKVLIYPYKRCYYCQYIIDWSTGGAITCESSGLLTGKYKRNEKPKASQGRVGFMMGVGSFLDSWSNFCDNDMFWNLLQKLTSIAKAYSKTVAQVSIRWLLQKEIVASAIIGVTSLKQLEENLGAAKGWELTEEEMKDLDAATSYVKGYPYDVIGMMNYQRKNSFLHK